ncbi:DNA polymerase ligase N-terminal domain-containing protein [Nanoarchaeota archaeon]
MTCDSITNKAPKGLERPIYVLHKHHARQLHYDLRLEIDNTLKSWAVPKGPPKDGRHLAVEVDDHLLGYADFEGEIPEGQYGAGKVEIFDNGTFELIERSEKKIIFNLKGKKLKGEYVLVKFKEEKDKKLWLWFKKS